MYFSGPIDSMKLEFLPGYRSPDGAGPLRLVEVTKRDSTEICAGTLRCEATGREFAIRDGAPLLVCSEDMTQQRRTDLRKIEYWDRRLDLQIRMGTVPEALAAAIRQHDGQRAARTEFLFRALKYRQPHKRHLLDLGCGDPLLTERFARLGFRCYALDFAPYRLCRNGSQYVRQGAYFERVSALMSRLPFVDGLFDVVFVSAALHHATPNREDEFRWCDPANMYDTLREIKRVLKPHEDGGRLILTGEGVYPDDMPIEDRHLERAARFNGCYESHYTMAEYVSQFERAGIFPMLFANQLDAVLYMDGYLPDGMKIPLLNPWDGVDQATLWKLRRRVRQNVPRAVLERILPDWIELKRLPRPPMEQLRRLARARRYLKRRRPAA